MIIYIKLADLLTQRGLSERSLARQADIRHVAVNEMCNNKTVRLPLSNLAKICEVLQCEINDILELRPE